MGRLEDPHEERLRVKPQEQDAFHDPHYAAITSACTASNSSHANCRYTQAQSLRRSFFLLCFVGLRIVLLPLADLRFFHLRFALLPLVSFRLIFLPLRLLHLLRLQIRILCLLLHLHIFPASPVPLYLSPLLLRLFLFFGFFIDHEATKTLA